MCEECRMNPCHPRCPNAKEPRWIRCDFCGEKIYVGDIYYEIENEVICKDCLDPTFSKILTEDDE